MSETALGSAAGTPPATVTVTLPVSGAAPGVITAEDRENIQRLITGARDKLSLESPVGALDDLVRALRLIGGEMLVLNTLQQAREAYWSGKEANGLADLMLKCTLGHGQAAAAGDQGSQVWRMLIPPFTSLLGGLGNDSLSFSPLFRTSLETERTGGRF